MKDHLHGAVRNNGVHAWRADLRAFQRPVTLDYGLEIGGRLKNLMFHGRDLTLVICFKHTPSVISVRPLCTCGRAAEDFWGAGLSLERKGRQNTSPL